MDGIGLQHRRFSSARLRAAQQSASEYQVKAAYLYNFAKMSQWPAQSLPDADSALIVGVYGGNEDFVNVLRATLAGKAINGHPVEIRYVHSAEELKYCHLVFFRASERATPSMIAALDHASVLLVGEENNFLDQGGMINLALTNGKISFDVNSTSLEHAHIRYGTNLPAQGKSEAGIQTESSRSLKSSRPPEYPAVARQLNLRGTVRLEALVRANASVKEVHVVGGHPMLAEAAVQAVMQWRYEVAPKESTEVVNVNFGQ